MFSVRFGTRGISLIEAMIVVSLSVIIFGALFAGTRYSLELIAHSRAKLSALSLANDRMELFRSFPYDDVGTVAGIPSGVIPQVSTTTLNGIEFVERVLVEYVDDPGDGLLTATTTDSNGIPSDYKRIKIEISWNVYDKPGQLALVSNIVPRSIETTEGGGSVRINVIDQDSLPLENAAVRLINTATTDTIDITKYTDASGVALFSGAPAASNYEVIVTAAGYSTDQTYVATSTNPNPITAPFSVLEADISTLTFQIDQLSDITVHAYSNITFDSVDEPFSDTSGIATSTNVTIASDSVTLSMVGSEYATAGSAYLYPISPSTLVDWEAATVGGDAPGSTSFRVQFFTASGTTYELIPDDDLPNNSTGFTTSIIPLQVLDPIDYPELAVGVFLETSNPSLTPNIQELRVFYRTAETPLTSTVLNLQGDKIIGTDSDAKPIYKFASSVTTDSSGDVTLTDVEFDSYAMTVPGGYDIAYTCPAIPFTHRGGVNSVIELQVAANSAHSLQVKVTDDTGATVPGASVLLENASTSYSGTKETNPCGTTFFSSLDAGETYKLTVTKPGYTTNGIEPFSIDGDASTIVILTNL